MKQFADLHVCPNLDDKEELERIIRKASSLGCNLIGVSLPFRPRHKTINFLHRLCRDSCIDLATRIDLAPKSSKDLLESLRLFRRRFDLVAVNCSSKSIARQAAKDHRVDLLVFSSRNSHRRFFDLAEATLASQSVAALEVNMALLLGCRGFSRARLLSCLWREAEIARRVGVSIVICSGAIDEFGLRSRHDFVSLAALFGMNDATALNAISVAPQAIVTRNRGKLGSDYVSRGVRVVRKGRNCGD
ncbi:MAG: hypothetical protein JSW72_06225 [Candidatus Bathyarchaeota archaeon]|nr:MAG: hypothetical protein JSW72_06225 [Candidatus Bathyarchaeota archaeon]